MSSNIATILDDDLLETLRLRAHRVDAENTFPSADFADLRDAGYLKLFVPTDRGGHGFTLEQVARAQRRLATAAPATALAVNMHLIWGGIARVFRERGDASLDWVMDEIAAGEVYALGISEPGNDAVLFDSTVRAEPDGEGGYRFYGTKIFTSLSPVWTRLGIFGRDDSDPDHPRLVHGIIRRHDECYRIMDDWDTVGMRGTQSHSTTLDGVHVPADRMIAELPVGPNAEPLVFAIFANFLLLIGSVYLGIGERAVRLAEESAHYRHSRSDDRRFADDPQVRDIIAEMGIRQLSARIQLEATARAVDESAPNGSAWFPMLTTAKLQASRAARRSVDDALEIVGGAAFRNGHELGRLYRDVAASVFHPSQERSVRRTVANWILGPIGEGNPPTDD